MKEIIIRDTEKLDVIRIDAPIDKSVDDIADKIYWHMWMEYKLTPVKNRLIGSSQRQ